MPNLLARLTPQPKVEEPRTQGNHRGVKKPMTTQYGRSVEHFLAQHDADVHSDMAGNAASNQRQGTESRFRWRRPALHPRVRGRNALNRTETVLAGLRAGALNSNRRETGCRGAK